MIITVTLNPSIDRTINLDKLKLGSINRSKNVQVDPGGKGVNVSRALSAFGSKTHAILICAGLAGQWFSKALGDQEISNTIVKSHGITRNNMTLVETDGTITKINEPGSALNDESIEAVKNELSKFDLKNNWVVFAGRPSPGSPENIYSTLADFVYEREAKVAVDASGKFLVNVINGRGPDLIKPNQHELSTLVDRPITTINAAIDASLQIINKGVKKVICSLGVDGALYVDSENVIHAEPKNPAKGNPVGAGDILLGIFLGAGADKSALKKAVAWAAASVELPGTSIPTASHAAKIEVFVEDKINTTRTLAEVI